MCAGCVCSIFFDCCAIVLLLLLILCVCLPVLLFVVFVYLFVCLLLLLFGVLSCVAFLCVVRACVCAVCVFYVEGLGCVACFVRGCCLCVFVCLLECSLLCV